MWTYSPNLLSTWPESEELADILWPVDDSPSSESRNLSVLERFGLTPKDLKNKRIRGMLESGRPQVFESMYLLAWLHRPDIPLYHVHELCQHLTAFGKYLRSYKDAIIGCGRPSKTFGDSPWLDAGLSNLYPLQSLTNRICGKEHARILREEMLRIKIDVVDFLAENLRSKDPEDISRRALHLARGQHFLQRLRDSEKLEKAHRREQSRIGYPKETAYSGGYDDIVGLVAYCEKEIVIGTFSRAKAQLMKLQLPHDMSSYVNIPRPSTRALVDEVICALQSDLNDEGQFYPEFFARTKMREERARLRTTEDMERDYIFMYTGDSWRIRWSGGETFHVRDVKGLRYIGYLLRFPNRRINVRTLYQSVNPSARFYEEEWESGIKATDQKTIDDVRARREETRRQLASGPPAQQRRRLEANLRFFDYYLSSSCNLYGKPRWIGGVVTKMRVNVTNNIANAKKKLRPMLPELAEHLDRYLHTGSTCIYDPPSDAIKWTL